jgi:hypothetical protein
VPSFFVVIIGSRFIGPIIDSGKAVQSTKPLRGRTLTSRATTCRSTCRGLPEPVRILPTLLLHLSLAHLSTTFTFQNACSHFPKLFAAVHGGEQTVASSQASTTLTSCAAQADTEQLQSLTEAQKGLDQKISVGGEVEGGSSGIQAVVVTPAGAAVVPADSAPPGQQPPLTGVNRVKVPSEGQEMIVASARGTNSPTSTMPPAVVAGDGAAHAHASLSHRQPPAYADRTYQDAVAPPPLAVASKNNVDGGGGGLPPADAASPPKFLPGSAMLVRCIGDILCTAPAG